MSTNEMSAKVRELKELQQLIEEATAEAEAIKDAIKAEMEARSVEEMTVDVFKVRWKNLASPARLWYHRSNKRHRVPPIGKPFKAWETALPAGFLCLFLMALPPIGNFVGPPEDR